MSGLIYDKDEFGRVKSVIDQQQEDFTNAEKESAVKQWVIFAGVLLIMTVGGLLAAKKFIK